MSEENKRASETAGIAGLGLIGGSAAKAYKKADWRVYGADRDRSVVGFAELSGVIDGELDDEALTECDIVIIALYPADAVKYIRDNSGNLAGKLVIDFCGTKSEVCRAGFEEAEKSGFTFVGGHPMAGTHNSGFKYSDADMFRGAPFVIVPPVFDDPALLDRVKKALSPLGMKRFSVTTAEEHDRLIAFTSQMAHVISSAYIKSPTAAAHKGFSAGSYRDMTRVAWLNPTMWAQLFIENKDNLLPEIESFIGELERYKDALEKEDKKTLEALLEEGRKRKEEVDG
ncbi:MAG: prephenate dehydrogenase [Clostridia bacterium]|nr:prephenate dehydrogenase [Clostridia bacterium]MBR7032107.1 prephenate dehydrogenase [Clostridia bacterium]